jgi:2-polyprenyl-3-methyl-5-hydroxy-6-metoxy-1,4-benzoquinol methylase
MPDEKQRLQSVAEKSLYTTFANTMTIEYCYEIYKRFLKEGNVLELGPAEGLMTEQLTNKMEDITVVEGSVFFCEQLEIKFPGIKVINSLFEDYEPTKKFSNILLGHVLEHVNDPIEILKLVKQWLKPDGIILAAVPNSRSLHRQASVIMGILPSEDSMSELDHHHGHRRIYNPESFRSDFIKAGFQVLNYGGYWLKPVSNSQLNTSWTKEMLLAFMKLGERYPDIAAEIYVVASH